MENQDPKNFVSISKEMLKWIPKCLPLLRFLWIWIDKLRLRNDLQWNGLGEEEKYLLLYCYFNNQPKFAVRDSLRSPARALVNRGYVKQCSSLPCDYIYCDVRPWVPKQIEKKFCSFPREQGEWDVKTEKWSDFQKRAKPPSLIDW